MSPGPMTTAQRGGLFYGSRAGGFSPNRVYGVPHGRTYAGQRPRFAVSPNDAGGHTIALDDTEAATITVNEDGSVTVTVENKPATNGNGNGNGHGEPVALPLEDGRGLAGRSLASRLLRSTVSRMSWVKDPDGSVVITPDDNETLFVSGDAIQAIVTAQPSEPGV